jgi:choline dehydrogenase-like flavoprotein
VSAGSDQTQFFAKPPEGKCRLSLFICLEHPLSHGSVHIESSDPTKQPRIDPGYFRHPVDAKIMAAGIDWLRKVADQPILKDQLDGRLLPKEGVSLESEEDRLEYVRNHISTQYHICGSAAMGEVVDARLKVKGVKGLRVIDASVFPGHVSGNIMSTVYAVAEKGADLIKEDDGRF